MIDTSSLVETMAHLGAHRLIPWVSPAVDDIERLEKETGGKLPEDYRYFLMTFGGVSLGDEDFAAKAPISEACPWGSSVAPGIFSPLDTSRHSIVKELRTFKGRLPSGVLPITHDAGGNLICVDVAGQFPGSVWFWDHEQRWFRDYFAGSFEEAAQELDAAGIDARRFSVHDIIRGWARLHADRFDRPSDYMGMYKMAPTFADFLRSLHRVPH